MRGDISIMKSLLNKSREFIYRNARPLDLARWNYLFEGGNKEEVLKALSFYQNEDGGFGHALEADSWNPNSSPIQTWEATELLHEIAFADQTHPIIQGILHYLESGADFNGKTWSNTVISNNDYPHAPWWHTESVSLSHNSYNPTACLAGFIIRFAEKGSKLYNLGTCIVKEAVAFLFVEAVNDMHTLSCYIRLMEYLENSNTYDLVDLKALKDKLIEGVKSLITHNKIEWETSYICKPSQFFNSRDSIFYKVNKEIAEYECEYIINNQLSDGSWNIPWNWNEYANEWAISRNWWKANVIIENMLYLKNFGKL